MYFNRASKSEKLPQVGLGWVELWLNTIWNSFGQHFDKVLLINDIGSIRVNVIVFGSVFNHSLSPIPKWQSVDPGSYLRKGYLAILWSEEFQEVLADLRIHS